MNKDSGDPPGRIRTYKTGGPAKWKINTLLTGLLEKDEEITLYKKRLKELETAFYYNLELLSERDLELSVLEKKLGSENEQVQVLIRERNELEEFMRVINDKNNRKINKLESKLALKEEEMKNIQRESITKINSLKRLLEDERHQQEKQISKMSTKFEIQKRKLIKSYRDEMDEKEKHYILEIDTLAGKLEQAFKEKKELLKAEEDSRNKLELVKQDFLEKENLYLEYIRKRSDSSGRKVNREVQCDFKPQVLERKIQTQLNTTTVNSQTDQDESEVDYVRKINFLQEQNEVLKYIVKDLKRNRGAPPEDAQNQSVPGCECFQIKAEIDKVNKKFETEINNLKKILEEENVLRSEEDGVIQSLETSVTFLKDKLLSELQGDFQGDDASAHAYDREIQVTLLEQKLTRRMTEENRRVHEKLEEFKKHCEDKLEKCLKPEPDLGSDDLLCRIRLEIQKLEQKIESDVKNLVKNNSEREKCEKNRETTAGFPESDRPFPKSDFPEVRPAIPKSRGKEFDGSVGIYCKNELSPEKFISIFTCNRQENQSNRARRGFGEQRGLRKIKNNLTLGR